MIIRLKQLYICRAQHRVEEPHLAMLLRQRRPRNTGSCRRQTLGALSILVTLHQGPPRLLLLMQSRSVLFDHLSWMLCNCRSSFVMSTDHRGFMAQLGQETRRAYSILLDSIAILFGSFCCMCARHQCSLSQAGTSPITVLEMACMCRYEEMCSRSSSR